MQEQAAHAGETLRPVRGQQPQPTRPRAWIQQLALGQQALQGHRRCRSRINQRYRITGNSLQYGSKDREVRATKDECVRPLR